MILYLLKADCDGTTFSRDVPIGFVVHNRDEAEKWASGNPKYGYSQSYEEVFTIDSLDELSIIKGEVVQK